MRFIRKHRPSPAMVVASIALLVALGGTSVAAISNVPLFSVGTPQLKPNAVVSSKVKNRSLLAVDFKQGQLPRGPRGFRGPQGPAGAPGPAGPSGPAGVAAPGYVAQVGSDTSTGDVSTSSQTFTDIPGASEAVTVPTGETGRIYVWFNAESACSGGTGSQYCNVRILVNGTEIEPAAGTDFAFDSTDQADETASSWESHGMIRVSPVVNAGTYTVTVQGRTTSAATTLRLDDWTLLVQRVRVT